MEEHEFHVGGGMDPKWMEAWVPTGWRGMSFIWMEAWVPIGWKHGSQMDGDLGLMEVWVPVGWRGMSFV